MIVRPLIVALALMLITGALTVSGCVSGQNDSLQQDKYVAVEEYLQVRSSLIGNDYPFPPHISPTIGFFYDGASNGSNWAEGSNWENVESMLNFNYYPEVNDSLKVLYGTKYYTDVAPRDTRTGLKIRGVYSLPFTSESGLIIESVMENGTIYGSVNGTPIILPQGEQWISPVISETRTTNGTTYDNKSYSYTAIYNSTWTISNLGTVDKSNLTKYKSTGTATGYYQSYG